VIIYTRGGTEDLYYFLPRREGPVHDFVISHLRPGDLFVDVGANIGYYTILGSLIGSRVIAVEPIPSTVAVLRVNLKLNNMSYVTVIDKCGWYEKGYVELKIPLGSYYGLASAYYDRYTECVKIKVECIKLDDILEKYDDIEIIKIDVEGAEYEVLRGLTKSLAKTKYVIVEVSRNTREILDFLRQHGFNIKKLRFTSYILAYRDD